jgi:DNA repair protein RecN (Recombination protein N)
MESLLIALLLNSNCRLRVGVAKRNSSPAQLAQLTIKSLGVIESAELEFGSGLTVLTGETGAGKTMVLTALGLVLGGKADSDFVRTGSERLNVSARFSVNDQVAELVDEMGGEIEDGELILSRTVTSAGKSRAIVGAAAATNSQLSEFGVHLVEVHAQSSTARLSKSSVQRELLDRHAGEGLPIDSYQLLLKEYKALQRRIVDLRSQLQERDAELEAIATFLADFKKVSPVEGELEAIDNEISKLGSVEEINADLSLALAILSDDDASVVSLLGQARRALEGLKEKDAALDPILENFIDAHYAITESTGELARYLASLEADPARFEFLQERKASINSLIKRYGKGSDKAQALAGLIEDGLSAATRTADLQGGDARLIELEKELEEVFASLRDGAEKIHTVRTKVAAKLSKSVTTELAALSMPTASFEVRVESGDASAIASYTEFGIDEVQFLFCSHPGANPLPITKAASGGELSRIMLAIEVVLAANSDVGTYIFDEVDAGVGGKAAVEVGRRLAALAKGAQVIVVTHLAQVAVWADSHLVISKDQSGSYSQSSVAKVEGAQREREVARLLSGQEDSRSAQEHAAELLAMVRASA